MNLKPLKDYIILDAVKEKTLIVSANEDPAKDLKTKFFVKAIGEEVKDIKVGDRVFVMQGVFQIEIDGQKYYFTKAEYVSMIIAS